MDGARDNGEWVAAPVFHSDLTEARFALCGVRGDLGVDGLAGAVADRDVEECLFEGGGFGFRAEWSVGVAEDGGPIGGYSSDAVRG